MTQFGNAVKIDIVISSINRSRRRIEEVSRLNQRIRIHIDTCRVADIMKDADLIIGSGGSSVWEMLYLGKPVILKIIAENQRQPLKELSAKGLVRLYETQADLIDGIRCSLDAKRSIRSDIVKDGTQLISSLMINSLVRLEEVSNYDIRRAYMWQQDDNLRRIFLSSMKRPSRREHFSYWRSKRGSRLDNTYSIYYGNIHVGQCGLDKYDAKEGSCGVWLYIGYSKHRGLGIGRETLRLLEIKARLKGISMLWLHVSRFNIPALKLYAKAGFNLKGNTTCTSVFNADLEVVRMEKNL